MVVQYTEISENNAINKENIDIAVGLGLVDNLVPSKHFYKAVETSKTYTELEYSIKKYYDGRELNKGEQGEKECDIVSVNIAKYLEKSGFILSPISLKTIHKIYSQMLFHKGLKSISVFLEM